MYKSTIILLLLPLSVFCQTDAKFPNSEKDIIKSFHAHLADENLLSFTIPTLHRDTSRAFIRQYKLTDQTIQLKYPNPKINPLSLPQEENPKNIPFYLKAGYGVLNNPFVEASYAFNSDKYHSILHFSYESIEDNKNENQKFTDIQGRAAFTYFLNDQLALNGELGYLEQQFGIFGESVVDTTMDRLKYTIPTIKLGLHNIEPIDFNINYDLNYQLRSLAVDETNENNHRLYADIVKIFGRADQFKVGISGNTELNKSTFKGETQNAYLHQINIYGSINEEDWRLRGGINTTLSENRNKIQPQAEFRLLFNNHIQPYLGIRSSTRLANQYNLYQLNPYSSPLITTLVELSEEYFIGIRGTVKEVIYEGFLGYKTSENQFTFGRNGNFFYPLLDDITTFTLALKSTVTLISHLTIEGEFAYYSYSTDHLEKAYDLPSWNAILNGNYNGLLNQNLNLNLNLNTLGGIHSSSITIENNNIISIEDKSKQNTLINLGLEASYKLSQHINGFFSVDNLLNNQQPRHFGYNQIGINPKLGIVLRY